MYRYISYIYTYLYLYAHTHTHTHTQVTQVFPFALQLSPQISNIYCLYTY